MKNYMFYNKYNIIILCFCIIILLLLLNLYFIFFYSNEQVQNIAFLHEKLNLVNNTEVCYYNKYFVKICECITGSSGNYTVSSQFLSDKLIYTPNYLSSIDSNCHYSNSSILSMHEFNLQKMAAFQEEKIKGLEETVLILEEIKKKLYI